MELEPLILDYKPCKECMLVETINPQPVRCHHDPTNENCNHKMGDGCSNFTVPCLSWSKIGVVIHLGFKQKDGKTHFIDVDLNVPSFRTVNSDEYNGGVETYLKYLERENPAG